VVFPFPVAGVIAELGGEAAIRDIWNVSAQPEGDAANGSGSGAVNATSIQDVAVSVTAPTDGQVFTYNAGTETWTPADVPSATPTLDATRLQAGTTYTFGSLPSGWSLTDNSGTASVTGGVVRLVKSSGSVGPTDGPRARLTLPTVSGRLVRSFRVRGRVAAQPGAGSRMEIALNDGTSGLALYIAGDGWGLWTFTAENGLASGTQALVGDGTDWWELEIRAEPDAAHLIARYGAGVGTSTPTSWTDVCLATRGALITPTTLDLYLIRTSGGTLTWDTDDVTFEPL
jgi:hypothetical protein